MGVFADVAVWWDAQPVPRGHPFLSTAVLGCWEPGFDEPGSALHVRLLHRHGDLVAALPLYQARGRYWSLSWAHVEPFDVIAVDQPEVIEYLPRWLDELPVVNLYRVNAESPIMNALPTRRRWQVQSEFNSPYVPLASGMEAIRSGMSKDFQRTLRRRRRRLEEMGSIEVREHQSLSDSNGLFEAGLAMEAAGWKGQRGHAVLNHPTHERWFRSLSEVAEDYGWLRICGLYLDERLLAFRYDIEAGGRRFGMLSAFDETPDVASHSPGTILLESVLEASAAAGVSQYEFGVGNDAWKYEWNPSVRHVYDVLLFGNGLLGRGAAQAARARRLLRR